MQINFGRAIRLDYEHKKAVKWNGKKVTQRDLTGTMEGKKPSIFDKETSTKIGEFLRAQFNDYSKETGVYLWQTKRGTFVLTGTEAKKAQVADYILSKDMEKIERKYPKKSHAKTRAQYNEKVKNAVSKRDSAIDELLENGRGYRPDSSITLQASRKGNLKELTYYSTTRTKNGFDVTCEVLPLD